MKTSYYLFSYIIIVFFVFGCKESSTESVSQKNEILFEQSGIDSIGVGIMGDSCIYLNHEFNFSNEDSLIISYELKRNGSMSSHIQLQDQTYYYGYSTWLTLYTDTTTTDYKLYNINKKIYYSVPQNGITHIRMKFFYLYDFKAYLRNFKIVKVIKS